MKMAVLDIRVRRMGDAYRVCLNVDGFEQYMCDKAVRASVARSPMQRALFVQALKAAGYSFDEDKLVRACIRASRTNFEFAR